MSNDKTREVSNVNKLQTVLVEQGAPQRNYYAARREDGKGGRLHEAANNVTMIAINVSLSGAPAQNGSVQKAKIDFDGLFNQAKQGLKFDHNDRARLNQLTTKHREGLTNEADRVAFDRVTDAFNQSWGGKQFGKEDWARFNARVAGLGDAAAPVAQAPAAAQPAPAAPAVAASSTNEYFDKYYLGTSFVGASLYGNDTDRANKVREDLNRMQT
jgi:hypothetical protein